MSTTKAQKPRPRRMLDGFPPETRVVIADVTWDAYESLVDAVGDGENCRVAYDGKDIEQHFDRATPARQDIRAGRLQEIPARWTG
jgi:hypothetical protein